jgi:hypothetical protein
MEDVRTMELWMEESLAMRLEKRDGAQIAIW